MKQLIWLVILFGTLTAAKAQQDEAAAPVRLARLTYFAGAVQVSRADNTGQDDPVLNMPLSEGTRLTCGDYGQAEVEFEDGSLLRVTPRSAVLLDGLSLEAGVAKTSITTLAGLVYFELRKSAGYSYLVSAGGVLLSPVENAVVRVSQGDGPAVFAVLSGSVRLDHGFSAEVRAGETLQADAKDDARYFLNQQVAVESWDSWNTDRDRAAADETEKRTAARDAYAGVQGYGWSDLDTSGTWYDVPGEGQVWQPAAADDQFDPYGYGNWVWQGVGYVWASGYAWGWTPYRCGRWEYFPGFGWGWEPDARCHRWGSGGGEVLIGHRRPPHYKEIPLPPRTPVKVHPILIVRAPDGPRPPLHWGGAQVIRGTRWTPLTPVGGVARTGPALGLSRDYPVNVSTHLAVVGKVQSPDAPRTPGVQGSVSGSKIVGNRPVSGGEPAQRPRPYAPVNPGRPVQEPVRTTAPVQTPVRPPMAPVAPPRQTQPAPAPVYHSPPPPAAAPPQPAPLKVETPKLKPTV